MTALDELDLNKKYNIVKPTRKFPYLPSVFRCIVNGSSGCGKTNMLINLLYRILDAEDRVTLRLCTKTVDQELYKNFIRDIKKNYPEHEIHVSDSVSFFNDDYFKSIKPDRKEIIIIDDMLGVMNKQDTKTLIHLFSASRPRGISIFFLTQRYSKLEISCRKNSNYLITFKPSLEEADRMCKELIDDFYNPHSLLSKFRNKPFYCLFFDLEKMKSHDIFEVFNIQSLKYYRSLGDLIDRLEILIGEVDAGNISESIVSEIESIETELIENGILSRLNGPFDGSSD